MSSNHPGLTLADLAGAREQVPVGDNFIEVRGVSTANALAILQRFPHLAKITTGFKIADLIGVAPDALAAIIAAGVGKAGDSEAEEQAADIPVELQMDLAEAIGRLTFKNGFGPFVQRLLKLAQEARSDLSSKVPSMSLPVTLKNSSPPVTAPPTSGDTPQDKSPPSSSSPTSDKEETATAA